MKAIISFGRMNPITTGHQKLVDKVNAVAKKEGGKALIYLSHSTDKKKNPLTYDQKIKYAKKAFGSVVQKSKSRTVIEVLKEIQGKYDDIVLVVGSDRVQEFDRLLQKYNGKDYTYNSIKTVSAGERDPDAQDVSGMSASKLRELASNGDFNSFKKGMPPKLVSGAKQVYDDIRKGMGINEETEYNNRYDAVKAAKKEGKKVKEFRAFNHRAGRSELKYKIEDLGLDESTVKIARIKKELKKHNITVQGSILSMIAGMTPAKLDMLIKGFNAVKPLVAEEVEKMVEELNEVLTVQQRMKKRLVMRRLKARIKRGRRIAKYKLANKEKLGKRSARKARNILRTKLAGKQGANYSKLPLASRQQLDRRLEKKKTLIKKIAQRQMPKVRKAEHQRLAQARKSRNEGLNIYRLDNKYYDDSELLEMVDGLLGRIEAEEISESALANLEKKADKSGISIEKIKEIYMDGIFNLPEDSDMTPEQFAFSCVNAYVANENTTAKDIARDKIRREKAADTRKHQNMMDRAKMVDKIRKQQARKK